MTDCRENIEDTDPWPIYSKAVKYIRRI